MERILVVDDEMGARTLLGIMLGHAGFTVITAKDANEALSLLEQPDRPDLIILDVMMPGMDGIELCRTIRRRPGLATLPILILSARTNLEDIGRGLEAGANDYLPKPVLNHDLKAKVRALIDMNIAVGDQ